MTDFQTIVSQRPKNLDEALECLRKALDYYHERDDYRAIFLRAYYIITVDVHAAVNQLGDYQKQIFFDPRWIDALAGKFSSLYFAAQQPPRQLHTRCYRRSSIPYPPKTAAGEPTARVPSR